MAGQKLPANLLLRCAEFPIRVRRVCQKACNQSVYAYEKMLAQGFFTMSDGCRVGVCGVMGANGVFQQYTSVCVRTAKYHSCVDVALNNSFIVAGPPRSGKTTFCGTSPAKLPLFATLWWWTSVANFPVVKVSTKILLRRFSLHGQKVRFSSGCAHDVPRLDCVRRTVSRGNFPFGKCRYMRSKGGCKPARKRR